MESDFTIQELTSITEIAATYPLIRQKWSERTESEFHDEIQEMQKTGTRFAALYADDKESGKEEMIGVASFWIAYRLYCGRFIQVANFIIDKDWHGKGAAKTFLNWFEDKGKFEDCQHFLLDAVTENYASHKLFIREGFVIKGYHFNKVL